MSRFDYPSEPDADRYEPKPVEDIDVPDFDAPDPPNFVNNLTLLTAVDPAEHASHALIDALATLEQQIALCSDKDLERANQLRTMLHRHEQHVALVLNTAAAKVDEILERLR